MPIQRRHGMRALIVLSSLVITLILVSVSVLLLGPQTPSNDQLDVKTQIYSHMCVSQHKVGPAFGIGELRASYTLPVRNWWSETIHIKKIVSSCSCTSAKLRDEVLAPGAETMLDVLVSHPSTGGDANISCRLIADNGKELLHRFRSVAYPLVQLDTKTGSVGFGEVNPGTQLTDSVSLWLYRPPMQSWPEIISVSSDSPSVNVEVSKDMECSELDNESGQRARLSLTMRVDAGSIPATRGATIDVQYRVGEQLGSTKIPVTWKVKPILGATPERLFISIDGKVALAQDFRTGAGSG